MITGSERKIINLSNGTPDLPPHPDVIGTLIEESLKPDRHRHSNTKGLSVLRNAVTAFYQRWYEVQLDPDSEVLPLIGSKEGIVHVCMSFLNKGEKALVPDPCYPVYRSAVKLAGGSVVGYHLRPENNWFPDFEQLNNLDLRGVKLMFVNYPHSPTGQVADEALFDKIVQFGLRTGILICHDNAYSFNLTSKPRSLLSVGGAKTTAIELNTLSKSHNMSGWRVGMLCGDSHRIEKVYNTKNIMDSGIFMPVQLAAAKALGLGKEWYASLDTVYEKRRKKVFELLNLIGCAYSGDAAGLFVWARVPGGSDGYALSDRLLNNAGIFVTPGGAFGEGGKEYIRVSLCASEDQIEDCIDRVKLTWSNR